MKHFTLVPGVLAVLWGSVLLLPLLAWASLQDSYLSGPDHVAAVLRQLFGTRAVAATLAGASAIVLGLAAVLYAALFAGADRHERKAARPAYWTALAVGSVAVFALLVVVNYLGLWTGR
jgi:hypothetical protein